MTRQISLIVILAACLVAAAPAADDAAGRELGDLREELRQTQQQLRELTGRIEQLSRAERPQRTPLSFGFGGPERPMVGIIMSATRDGDGVRLAGVTPEGPADQAGLKSGDVVVEINGEPLAGPAAVERAYELLEGMAAGDVFQFAYDRDGERLTATVTAEIYQPSFGYSYVLPDVHFGEDSRFGLELDQFKDYADRYRDWQLDDKGLPEGVHLWRFGFAWSGLELARLNPDLARYFGASDGVLVIASDLKDGQLKGGDVIVAIDGEAVDNPKQAMRLLSRFRGGEQIPLRLIRDHAPLELSLVAPESAGGSGSLFFRPRDS